MGAQRPTVSVVVATFNGERFLRPQLDSILGQTRIPDEIIITDDGSTDHTLRIVAEVKKVSPPSVSWTVATQPKALGPAGNFLAGCRLATGDLIALADQDDWWFPTKIQRLVEFFSRTPHLLLAHSDAQLVDSSGSLLGMTVLESLRLTRGERRGLIRGEALAQLVRRNLVTGHTVMMTPWVVDAAGDIPPGWLHDEWWALIAGAHRGVRLCPEVLGHYRQHEVNQVGATRSGVARLRERLGEPQGDFRARHRIRHQGLEEYLAQHQEDLPGVSKRLLAGRLAHYRWQATLPPGRALRVLPILGTLITGGYHRYRRGVFDALRDLFQPGASPH
jgi:glycosyltransferase involved in cell wall biosynthesis